MKGLSEIKEVAIDADLLSDKAQTEYGLSAMEMIVYVKLVKALCKYIKNS